jgi:hypothetical protein
LQKYKGIFVFVFCNIFVTGITVKFGLLHPGRAGLIKSSSPRQIIFYSRGKDNIFYKEKSREKEMAARMEQLELQYPNGKALLYIYK